MGIEPTDLTEASYERQRRHGRTMSLPSCYGAPNSVDNWRHERMRAHVLPLVSAYPGARWLTVGDGAWGSDANYLMRHGADAVASSLVPDTLAAAAERGYIRSFMALNAESTGLVDASFDFVLCKEAFHHFPRPPTALYELLRVARRAVVLIEPQSQGARPFDLLRTLVKRALRGDATTEFEPAGNYIYRVSPREVQRLMTALGGHAIAFRRFNDFYWSRLASADRRKSPASLAITRLGVATQNMLCRSGLMAWGLCCLVVIKGPPEAALLAALRSGGFTIVDLPRNPYAGQTAESSN